MLFAIPSPLGVTTRGAGTAYGSQQRAVYKGIWKGEKKKKKEIVLESFFPPVLSHTRNSAKYFGRAAEEDSRTAALAQQKGIADDR